MREYEISVIYALSVMESGGPDASLEALTTHVEARGGKMLKADHWGRRRMAYPIRAEIDGDYIIARVELEPAAVRPLGEALRIDERVYRHLVVRADELPPPPVPREPRRRPVEQEEAPPVAPVAESAISEPVSVPPAATMEAQTPSSD